MRVVSYLEKIKDNEFDIYRDYLFNDNICPIKGTTNHLLLCLFFDINKTIRPIITPKFNNVEDFNTSISNRSSVILSKDLEQNEVIAYNIFNLEEIIGLDEYSSVLLEKKTLPFMETIYSFLDFIEDKPENYRIVSWICKKRREKMSNKIEFIKTVKLLDKLKKESIVIKDLFIIIKNYLMDLKLEDNTEYHLKIGSANNPDDFFSLFDVILKIKEFEPKTYSNPDIFIKDDLNLIIIKDGNKYMIKEDL